MEHEGQYDSRHIGYNPWGAVSAAQFDTTHLAKTVTETPPAFEAIENRLLQLCKRMTETSHRLDQIEERVLGGPDDVATTVTGGNEKAPATIRPSVYRVHDAIAMLERQADLIERAAQRLSRL